MPKKQLIPHSDVRGISHILVAVSLVVVGVIGFAGYRMQALSHADASWTTAFEDTFSGSSLNSEWLVDTGTGYAGGPQNGFGTDEIETVTNNPANLSVSGGNLKITPLRSDSGAWTSARIETNKVFKPASGATMHIESRLQLPDVHGAQAAGYWPAFWAMGETQRANRWLWPANGEFDFMESVNGVAKNWSTLHCGFPASWGGPCGEPSGISNGGVAAASGDVWGQYHTYGFEWDRSRGTGNDQLRWYVDGNIVHTVNQTDARMKDVWATMTSHNGYFIILNVAMGGQFPAALGGGPTAATTSGVPMLVDYVRVQYKDGGAATPTPPSPTPPSPTPTPPSPTPTPPSPTPTPPSSSTGTPSNLVVKSKTTSSVTLSWTSNSSAATSFDILRGEGGAKIATVTGTTFTDSGLANNTTYVYSVRGNGVTTPQVSVTTGATTTPSPTPTPPSPTPTPPSPTPTPSPVSGTSTIQAEKYNSQSGTILRTTTDTGAGQMVGSIGNGNWLSYSNVDFGTSALTQFSARVASGAAGGASGLVEVHLDSLSNPSIGSFSIGNTGGWQSWRTVPANIKPTTGKHTVYLKFVTASGKDFVNLNWFKFSK